MAYQRPEQKISRLSAAIALVLHTVVVGALVLFAAREGMLGKQLRKLAVTLVPKEKPPEKPKDKSPEPPPEKPAESKPKEQPANLQIAKPAPAPLPESRNPAPAAASAAPLAAPPVTEMPSFDFEGGKVVESTSNPLKLYKGFVEYTLRSNWQRPEGVSDLNYVAEVELTIDPSGRILGSAWKKGSGDAAWDDSVRQVVARTPSLVRPPPKGFPGRIVVRFDVQGEADALTP